MSTEETRPVPKFRDACLESPPGNVSERVIPKQLNDHTRSTFQSHVDRPSKKPKVEIKPPLALTVPETREVSARLLDVTHSTLEMNRYASSTMLKSNQVNQGPERIPSPILKHLSFFNKSKDDGLRTVGISKLREAIAGRLTFYMNIHSRTCKLVKYLNANYCNDAITVLGLLKESVIVTVPEGFADNLFHKIVSHRYGKPVKRNFLTGSTFQRPEGNYVPRGWRIDAKAINNSELERILDSQDYSVYNYSEYTHGDLRFANTDRSGWRSLDSQYNFISDGNSSQKINWSAMPMFDMCEDIILSMPDWAKRLARILAAVRKQFARLERANLLLTEDSKYVKEFDGYETESTERNDSSLRVLDAYDAWSGNYIKFMEFHRPGVEDVSSFVNDLPFIEQVLVRTFLTIISSHLSICKMNDGVITGNLFDKLLPNGKFSRNGQEERRIDFQYCDFVALHSCFKGKFLIEGIGPVHENVMLSPSCSSYLTDQVVGCNYEIDHGSSIRHIYVGPDDLKIDYEDGSGKPSSETPRGFTSRAADWNEPAKAYG